MPETKRPLKVFLSYASQDKPVVRELSGRLASEGWIDSWLDEKKLLPGQDWRIMIEEAVEASDIVIICLSSNSVSKEGYVQKELRYAREIALEKPEETIFLIPLRLDECEVPRGLRFYQWVDYFGDKKEDSYSTLIESLKLRHEQKLLLEEAERARKEKLERDAAEEVAREKADKEAKEKERLVFEKHAREKAEREAAEKVARDKAKAEKDVVEKVRLEAEELAETKAALEKAERNVAKKSIKYPLARLKGMQEFMEFTRDPNWKPSLIDISLLKQLGMAKGKEILLIQALRFLGVIDGVGIPTNEFDNLKIDYRETLKRLVQEKYSDLFSSIPLRKANQIRLVSYFGKPVDAAEYQTKLFVWFCEQSGIELPKSIEEEKLALDEATSEKAKKHAIEKARLDAEELAKQKTAKEKAEHRATEKAKRDNIRPNLAEDKPAQKPSRIESKKSAPQSLQDSSNNQLVVGVVGLIAIIGFVIAVAVGLSSLNNNLSPTAAPTSTYTSSPINTFEATNTSTKSITSTPQPTPTNTIVPTSTDLASEIVDDRGVQMILVPEGEFKMGEDDNSTKSPAHQVYLSSFFIDKYEVTNVDYKACVFAGICQGPTYFGSDSRTSYYDNVEFSNYPVIFVDWNMSRAYCEQWRTARLPTEAEWEKAARGPSGNIYPWGNSIDGKKTNLCDKSCTITAEWFTEAGLGSYRNINYDDGYADTAPVDAYPNGVSIYGIYNLVGNVMEWTSSLHMGYPYKADDGREDLTGSEPRVVRGFSWASNYGYQYVHSAERIRFDSPYDRSSSLGFRCAKSIP